MAEHNTQTESEVHFAVGCSPVCDIVRKPKRRKRKSRPWHRTLGAISALPLIWVMITGVLLNHEEDFGFTETELSSSLVLSAYGMVPQGEPMSVSLQDKVVTFWDGQVFYGDSVIDISGTFLGAVCDGHGIAIVCDESIIRIDADGELIEKIDELSLPSLPLLAVAVNNDTVAIQNAEGWHSPDADWLECNQLEGVSLEPVLLTPLVDKELTQSISTAWAGGGIPLSRLILDLHSGNFLGAFAKYFYDFVVFCTLWLIGTGLVLQYRCSRRNKPNN